MQTDANGNTTRYEYNAKGQLVKVIDPLGHATTYTYGGTDKVTAITDANGNTIRYEYNTLGRKVREIDALGNAISYGYDALGNLLAKTDPSGQVTTFAYDPLNRVKEQLDPAGGRIVFEYSPQGQVAKITDPLGNATDYEYDALGRNTRTTSADTGATTYAYNADGTLKAKSDANGTTVSYSYDTAGRIQAAMYPDPSQNVVYTYDNCPNGRGRLCAMSDPSGTVTYAYDTLGRVITEQKDILDVVYRMSYTYDQAGNLASTTYPSGRTVFYGHDQLNRTNGVTARLNNTQILASAIGYDPQGNLISLTYGNGLTLSRTYGPANLVTSIGIPQIMQATYSYDPSGNIVAITDGLNPSASKSYSYDPAARLTGGTGPWGALALSHDANGNRLSQENGTSANYQYDANRLASVTNGQITNYAYDDTGNTMSVEDWQYVYSQNNRLLKAVENGKVLGKYTYNGKGERIVKRTGPAATNSASAQTTVYHYDQAGRLIEETAGNGKLLADYVYLDATPLAMIRKQGDNEETFYYHNDHLGTSKVLTDKLGKVVWNGEFDPFGNEVQAKGRQGGAIRKVENNLRFPGQYWDAETGLHYNYHRYYDPEIGRYITADPIGLDGGMNLFVYTYGNPVGFTDPRGLFSTFDAVYHYFAGGGSSVSVRFTEVDAGLMPNDFPGYKESVKSMYRREGALNVDKKISKDIGGWAGHITFRLNGKIQSNTCEWEFKGYIGAFKDSFDFNSMPWGARLYWAEIVTRMIGTLPIGTDYDINFSGNRQVTDGGLW